MTFVGHPENEKILPAAGSLAIHTKGSGEQGVFVQSANRSMVEGLSETDYHLGPDMFVFAAGALLEDVASCKDLQQIEHGIRCVIEEDGSLSFNEDWQAYVRYYSIEESVPAELVDYYKAKKLGP